MLLEILMSFAILPKLLTEQFNLDSFLNLTNSNNQTLEIAPKRIFTDYLDVKITAQSAIGVDIKSGKVLYQKNPDQIRSIASITKLMAALVFLDHNPGWQKEFFTIASDRRNGNIIHLNTGEILTIRNLFYTALIPSDNDAIMALVRSTGLSEEEFTKQMNKKAKNLELFDTEFVDPTGLKAGNKSSVRDIVKLLERALQNEEIRKVTSTNYYEFEVKSKGNIRTVKLRNTDLLLNSYLNIIGGKTGFLEEGGYCLAVKIKGEASQEIIVVVLGSASSYDRFQDVKAIVDWIFANYQW